MTSQLIALVIAIVYALGIAGIFALLQRFKPKSGYALAYRILWVITVVAVTVSTIMSVVWIMY
jgi:hypothetical protein